MDREQLIKTLSAPTQFQMVANSIRILESNTIDIADLFEISFNKKKEVAFRASWMLEFLMENRPEDFHQYIDRLFLNLPLVRNQSAMRHYCKMVALLTDKKVHLLYRKILANTDFEPVIEILFTWLINDSILVASKVHSMQALANLSRRYNWITAELLQTICHLESKESVAFFARAKVIKKTLLQQMNNS